MDWQTVAIIALVVVLIVGVRMTSSIRSVAATEAHKKTDEARTILENRYALGELDDDEFARRLQVLTDERKKNRHRQRQPID